MAKIIGICQRCGGWVTVPTNWPKAMYADRKYCDDCVETNHESAITDSQVAQKREQQLREQRSKELQLRLRERDARAPRPRTKVVRVPGGRVITRGQVGVSPRSGTIKQPWAPALYSQFGIL